MFIISNLFWDALTLIEPSTKKIIIEDNNFSAKKTGFKVSIYCWFHIVFGSDEVRNSCSTWMNTSSMQHRQIFHLFFFLIIVVRDQPQWEPDDRPYLKKFLIMKWSYPFIFGHWRATINWSLLAFRYIGPYNISFIIYKLDVFSNRIFIHFTCPY